MEKCVKCALPDPLAFDWPPIVIDAFTDNLERQILSTSEIVVRGSRLVNEMLLTGRGEMSVAVKRVLECVASTTKRCLSIST